MKKKNFNYTQLALDITRGKWLLADAESLLPVASAFMNREIDFSGVEESDLECRLHGQENAQGGEPEDKGKVAIIPLKGTMTKYDTCDNYGTVTIADVIDEFRARQDIVAIVLDIDSPGGCINSVMPLVQAIQRVQADGKPIIVHADTCASAAFWVASQCDAIFMDNDMSEIGSVGVYASFVDDREDKQTGFKVISVYADESSDKNKAIRDALEGKYETMKEELSDIVARFTAALKAGRPDIKGEEPGVFTGAMFETGKAIELGMADGQQTLSEVINTAFVRAEYK